MHFLPSLNWNLVQICKGWKLTHCKFTTWLFNLILKCVVLCILSSYPSCNIYFILKVYVGLKYLGGRGAGMLFSMGGGYHSGGISYWGGGADTPLHSMVETICLKCLGQFSNQMFSKWNIKALANACLKREPIATPSRSS